MKQIVLSICVGVLIVPEVLAQNNVRASDEEACGTGILLDAQEITRKVLTYQTQTATEHKKKNGDKEYTVTTSPSEEERKTYRVTVRLNGMIYTAESGGNVFFGYNPTRFVLNDPVQTCVRGKKLVLMRPDGKEYKANIIQTVREPSGAAAKDENIGRDSGPQRPTPEHRASPTSVRITSSPAGAEIEIDGAFVGNTPSKVELDRGEHDVTISKSGFKKYNRKVRLSGGDITLNAELER